MNKCLASTCALAVLLAFAAGDAQAQRNNNRGNRGQDIAREALQRGEVLPMARILTLVAQYLPGDVIGVELDTQRDMLRYEIRVLTAAGEVRELRLDARTGAFISIED
jgi:uncharacterized membrane protein YkoI